MMTLRIWTTAASSLLLAGCATVPQQQVEVSGAFPAGRSYAVIQPVKDAATMPAWAGLESCLLAAGLQPAPRAQTPPQILVQAAFVQRPARSVVLEAGEDLPPRGPKPPRNRDRAELVLTLTDRTSGAVQWRGKVSRLLGKAEPAGDGTVLVAPLCAALRVPPSPAPG